MATNISTPRILEDNLTDGEKIHLLNGDCLELMQQIPDSSIDMVLCDPPYGTTRNKWDAVIPLDLMWEQLIRITKPTAAIVLFSANPFTSKLIMSNPTMFRYDLIWDKCSTTGFLNAKKMPLRRHEIICVFYKKPPTYNPHMEMRGRPRNKGSYNKSKGNGDSCYGHFENITSHNNVYYPTSIIVESNAVQTGKLHPTQKPTPLFEYLITTYTNAGDTVLDFAMGSGTAGVACKNTGRKFIGMELDENYFKIAADRIAATGA